MCEAPSTWRASTWAMAAALAQRGIQRVDGRAGHAEGLRHAFLFHHQHGGLIAFIFAMDSLLFWIDVMLGHARPLRMPTGRYLLFRGGMAGFRAARWRARPIEPSACADTHEPAAVDPADLPENAGSTAQASRPHGPRTADFSPRRQRRADPEQKRFNTLIRQIDQARRTLAAWQEHTPLYAQAYAQLVVPLAKDWPTNSACGASSSTGAGPVGLDKGRARHAVRAALRRRGRTAERRQAMHRMPR